MSTSSTSVSAQSPSRASTPASRRITLPGVANARDLGGIEVAGGHIAERRLLRTAALGRMENPADLTGLGVGTVIDLRTAGEIAQAPDPLPTGIVGLHADVLGDAHRSAATMAGRTGQAGEAGQSGATEQLNEALESGAVAAGLRDSYRDIVLLPSARSAYRDMFSALADYPAGQPAPAAVFHCAAGKDRTGWAAAAVLLLLGADQEDIYADYLQSNDDYAPVREKILAAAPGRGVDPDTLAPLLKVQPGYLDYALELVQENFGGIEGYFTDALGLDDDQLSALRSRLVE